MNRLLLNIILFVFTLLLGTQMGYAQSYSDENDNLTIPFKTTTITNGSFSNTTQWYTIRIANGKYWQAAENQIDCVNASDFTDSNYFCFVGNNINGFQIYCKAFGPDFVMYCASSESHASISPTKIGDAKVPNTFKVSRNSDGYNFYYPGVPTACLNDLRGNGILGLWNNSSAPSNSGNRLYFEAVTVTEPDPVVPAVDNQALKPVTGDVHYIYMKSGEIHAFPVNYLKSFDTSDTGLVIIDKNGVYYTYDNADIKEISMEAPANLPTIDSFKFNNKFNDMLIVDADGVIDQEVGTINVAVGGIGKRLVPSFKLSNKDAQVYVIQELQESKKTSRRFESPVTYTVCYQGHSMLRETIDGNYIMCPFGRDYLVSVDYLCDHPTNSYGIPVVDIKTNDGTMISSKDLYWDATIKIDGAGFLPDMDETPMQIKGRGNSSWSAVGTDWWGNYSNPKNPYRIKFAEKQKPLGMKAGKNWCLIAQAQTGSMTSNPIGTRVAEMVGTAGANHYIPVELYINGDYRGSYCLTEKVGFSNNSIDIDDESTACLLEWDMYYDGDSKFQTKNYTIPVNIKEPDFTEGTTQLTVSNIRSRVNSFVTGIYNGEGAEKYCDPVQLARFMMVNEFIINQEIMHPKSTFLYNENILSTDSLFVFGPVWDLDWSYGYETSRTYFSSDATKDFWTMSSMEIKNFWNKIRFSSEELNKQYYRVWDDFYNNHLEDLLEYCDDYYALVSKSLEHDKTKWNNGGSSSYSSINTRAKKWLRTRADYVYKYLSNTLGYADKDYLLPDEPIDTAIDDIATNINKVRVGIYDIQGRKMDCDFRSLPSGIYIVNGKKMMKR